MVIKVYMQSGKTKLLIAEDTRTLFRISSKYNRWEFL